MPERSLAARGDCENIHEHEPMLVYEVSGATLSGTMDRTLTVYEDGALLLSSAVPGEPGTCARVHTTPKVVSRLYQELANAGALTLCDDEPLFIDMPLHTVTLLRGDYQTSGWTFSYWNVYSGYVVVDDLLEKFIQENFHGV